jgi:hypothetical protein
MLGNQKIIIIEWNAFLKIEVLVCMILYILCSILAIRGI